MDLTNFLSDYSFLITQAIALIATVVWGKFEIMRLKEIVKNQKEDIKDLKEAEKDVKQDIAVLGEKINNINTNITSLKEAMREEYKNLREYILNLMNNLHNK